MTFTEPATLLSAFLLGFLGSAHCLGMCGGLAGAMGLHSQRPANLIAGGSQALPPFLLLTLYNAGRILSYCLAGFVVGSVGFWLSQSLATLSLLRYLAALMLILLGLYLGGWFNGLAYSEKLGSYLWRYIQPLAKNLLPVKRARDALLLGAVWGWLPCGLVYSALIWASLQASILESALIMLCFGLGTLPSMLATGYFARQFSQLIKQPWLRRGTGVALVIFGLWSLPAVHRWMV